MKKIFKNYCFTFIIIFSLIIGSILGIIFKEKILFLKPLGDLYLNMLLCIVVPLIFINISSSFGKIKNKSRIGKILLYTFIVFIITSLISSLIGVFSIYKVNLINNIDLNSEYSYTQEKLNLLIRIVNMISTSDFSKLLSKDNLIALILASCIFGIALNMTKEKGKKLTEILDALNDVMKNIIKIIMYYSPIGITCYMASMVGTYGKEIIKGYGKVFIIYTIVCIFVYFVIYSLYIFILGSKKGLKIYWKNILIPTLTALSTCSSAASISINKEATRKIGVSEDISSMVIPLGTSFHKEGSVIGSVFKIMFIVCLFKLDITIGKIIGLSILATLLVTAVPVGGGTISEMLIISFLGAPISALPALTIIATIIDAPATVLNVTGDVVASVAVNKFIEKKDKV